LIEVNRAHGGSRHHLVSGGALRVEDGQERDESEEREQPAAHDGTDEGARGPLRLAMRFQNLSAY
jgi:hypothetical protein